jgi:hypothetical protein
MNRNHNVSIAFAGQVQKLSCLVRVQNVFFFVPNEAEDIFL